MAFTFRPLDNFYPFGINRRHDPFEKFLFGTDYKPTRQFLYLPCGSDDEVKSQQCPRAKCQHTTRQQRTGSVLRGRCQQKHCPSQNWKAVVDISNFDKSDINIVTDGQKVIVTAKKEKHDGEDFQLAELRKTLEAPADADLSKLDKKFCRGRVLIFAPIVVPESESETEMPMVVAVTDGAPHDKTGNSAKMESENSAATSQQVCMPDPKTFGLQLNMSHFTPEDIKITTKGKIVTVTANKQEQSEDQYYKSAFQRSFLLPENVDPQKLRSKFTQDGQLIIAMATNEQDEEVKKNDAQEQTQ